MLGKPVTLNSGKPPVVRRSPLKTPEMPSSEAVCLSHPGPLESLKWRANPTRPSVSRVGEKVSRSDG